MQELNLTELADSIRRLPFRRWSRSGGWLLAAMAIVAMSSFDQRLVYSGGAGMAVMLLIYGWQRWKPELPSVHLRNPFAGLNQRLILTLAGGSFATLTTYLAASIWAESDSHWVAASAIVQGAGTLMILGILLNQMLNREETSENTHHALLSDLTHTDPLRRLIAVKQLSNLVAGKQSHPPHHREIQVEIKAEIKDCFRLMLRREPEPIVRDAVVAGLQAIESEKTLHPSGQPRFDARFEPEFDVAPRRRRTSARRPHSGR